MYTYWSNFFSGVLDPTWPHILLIGGSLVGGALVGLGVILEAHKILSLPTLSVFIGIVLEAICTLLLFGFDEGISSKQQSTVEAQQEKIIALETKLAARSFSSPQAADIAGRLKPFSPLTFQIIPYWDDKESFELANRIDVILENIGWKLENPTRFTMLAGVVAGVVVSVDKRASGNARNAAKELASALTANGVDAKEREEEDPTTNPPSERINMSVGIKP
jgi:hypothetical protein